MARLLLVAATALVFASGASAHATPLASVPANGAVLAVSPGETIVTFDSPVHVAPGNAAIRDDGLDVLAAAPHVVGGRRLVLPLRRLGRGEYSVRWSIGSEDGHEQEGVIAFAVGKGLPAPRPALTVRGYLTWQRIALRTALFAGVLVAFGATVFAALVGPVPMPLLFVAFLLAFAGGDALSHTAGAAGTRFAHAMLAATVAAAVGAAAAALTPRLPPLRHVAAAAALVLFPCPTLAGHALDPNQPSGLAAAVDLVHLGGAAVWIGGVAVLLATRGAGAHRFGRIAGVALVLVAAGGVARAVTELGSVSELWTTGYGRLLLVKTGLFAAALVLAHRRRLWPEAVLLAALLVAVGSLTDLRPGSERPRAGYSVVRSPTSR